MRRVLEAILDKRALALVQRFFIESFYEVFGSRPIRLNPVRVPRDCFSISITDPQVNKGNCQNGGQATSILLGFDLPLQHGSNEKL